MRLENKVALITGAAGGIGNAIATLFIKEGATVIISDLNDEKGNKAVKEFGEKAHYMHLDVSSEEEWKNVTDMIVEKFGRLDILVNNAGVIGFENPAWGLQDPEHASLESWHTVHSINLDGTFLGCKNAIRVMKEKGGSIVNMSSRSGVVGVPGAAAYASSKAAIRNHTKSVALYCAGSGYPIRANSLHPAAILTPMWDIMLGTGEKREEGIKAMTNDIPLKRLGTPEDVAYGALFLASDESGFMTGSELSIDGGILAGTATSPRKGE